MLQRRGDVGNWNPISGDPYKKPCPQEVTGHVGKNYPPALLNFLWLLLYAHLSPESNRAIKILVSRTSNLEKFPQQAVTDHSEQAKARKSCRCLVLVISVAVRASNDCWRPGYFTREGRSAMITNAMGMQSQTAHLLVSAIIHSCSFFADIGLNPTMPDLENTLDFAAQSTIGLMVTKDLLLLHTVGFCAHVHA